MFCGGWEVGIKRTGQEAMKGIPFHLMRISDPSLGNTSGYSLGHNMEIIFNKMLQLGATLSVVLGWNMNVSVILILLKL